MLERLFKISQNNSTVKTEITGGLTTFMTMAYILAVNPSVLSAAGMDPTAVLLATAIASFIGTVCMGVFANLPIALSAGMGLNAYLAYTVVLYAQFYDIDYMMLLGRVMSGKGGDTILRVCNEILADEYPELAKKCTVTLPDEKMRRVGQSVAAASLPKI